MNLKKLVKRTYKGVIAIIVLALLAGILFFYIEKGQQNITFFESIYWAVVTMTTVGYGDFSPTTTAGKIVFIFLGTAGVVL